MNENYLSQYLLMFKSLFLLSTGKFTIKYENDICHNFCYISSLETAQYAISLPRLLARNVGDALAV